MSFWNSVQEDLTNSDVIWVGGHLMLTVADGGGKGIKMAKNDTFFIREY